MRDQAVADVDADVADRAVVEDQVAGLQGVGFDVLPSQGTYFANVDFRPLWNEGTDVEFAHWLPRKIGVAGVPGSSFFTYPENRYIRLNFAKKPATLHAAGERLLRLANF